MPLRTKRALLSVHDKAGIVEFARALVEMGWAIIGSRGTTKELRKVGLVVSEISEIVGFPPLFDHRVLTESIKISGAIVSKPTPEHDEERAQYGIDWIDMVVVDLYPLKDAIQKDGTEEAVIKNTDIGGVTTLREAAKGRRVVICDPVDRQRVIDALQKDGDVNEEMRRWLASKAEFIAAQYCLDSARFHSEKQFDGILGRQDKECSWGENPYQKPAALFACETTDPLAIQRFEELSGSSPSYTNLCGVDHLVDVISRLAESFRVNYDGKVPHTAIGAKHGSPVGAAIDWASQENALRKMLWGDPHTIWGGEVITNFPIAKPLANILIQDPKRKDICGSAYWMLNMLLAPDFDEEAIQILSMNKGRRLMKNPALLTPKFPSEDKNMIRPVRGGFLRQPIPEFVFNSSQVRWNSTPLPKKDLDTLIIAWAVAWISHANGFALAKDRQLIGADGQPSTVLAVKSVIERAKETGHGTQGSIFAANAFLPFADSAELIVDAGCVGGVVPAGGVREDEVMNRFKKANVDVTVVPEEFRGFARH